MNNVPKKPSTKTLKAKLWRVFSEYIRRRDEKDGCISCGKKVPWKEAQAGHYIPRTAGLSTYFDERNVNLQCVACNLWRHGNLSGYAIGLRKKLGNDILEDLDKLRVQTRKISSVEYQNLISHYKSALANTDS